MTRTHRTVCSIASTLAAWALLVTSLCAQAPRISDQLALARICASEAGLPERRDEGGWRFTDDCAAIHRVITFGAQQTGMRWQGFARAYSGRLFDPARTGPRAWVAHLRPDGEVPYQWPTQRLVTQRDGSARVLPHAPWRAYRDAWMALYAHAGDVIAGRATAPCEGNVSDWGGLMDRERAHRLGLIWVECGTTLNDFYIRPSWASPDQR